MTHGDDALKAALREGTISPWTAARHVRAQRAAAQNSDPARPRRGGQACRICGGTEWWPHKRGGRDCKQCAMRRAAESGQRKLELADAAYARVLLERLPEPELGRVLRGLRRKGLGAPIAPSRLFPGLRPGLDERLIREGKARDVACLTAIAAIKPDEQREFYERYLKDPGAAQRWADLPAGNGPSWPATRRIT